MKPFCEVGTVTLYRADALDFLRLHTADVCVLDPPRGKIHDLQRWLDGVLELALQQCTQVAIPAQTYALSTIRDHDIVVVNDTYDSTQRSSWHPNRRPMSWVEEILERTEPRSVLDPFAGSGIFLLECLRRGILACGSEIDDGYCAGIREALIEEEAALARR